MERQEKLLGAYVRDLAEGMRTAGRFATARHYEAAAGRLLEYLGKEEVPMVRELISVSWMGWKG